MIKKIKSSLTVKIFILVTVLLTASSAVTYGAISGFLPTYYSNRLMEDMDIVSQEMLETIASYDTIEEASYTIGVFENESQVTVTVLDKQGKPVWPVEEDEEAENTAVEGAASVYEYAEAGEAITAESGYDENDVHSAVKQYKASVGGEEYTVIVSKGMHSVSQAIEILHQIFPYILGISIVVAILLALAASLYLTMPIVRLSQISRRMASLDFGEHYQGKRTDEVGVLGTSLNELAGNLSAALEELRQSNEKLKSDIEMEREAERRRIAFFSAVSHELKTPITILKGHLSGMLQGVGAYQKRDYYLQRSQETAEKMETMVQELLTVSRIENHTFVTQRMDVAEQLRQQIAELAELAENKGLEWMVEIPEHLYASVHPTMLEKVFSNLLMNAIRYTPEGNENQIRIVLKERQEEGKAFDCLIENTGVFLPEEAIPHLFEAFYRVEQSRNRQTGGSGLGLYIVKMILDRHKAEYSIENTPDGVGFFFCI